MCLLNSIIIYFYCNNKITSHNLTQFTPITRRGSATTDGAQRGTRRDATVTSAQHDSRPATAACARLDPGNPTPQPHCNSAHKKITSERNLSVWLNFNDHPLSLKSQILVNAAAAPNEAVSLSYARIVRRSRSLSNL